MIGCVWGGGGVNNLHGWIHGTNPPSLAPPYSRKPPEQNSLHWSWWDVAVAAAAVAVDVAVVAVVVVVLMGGRQSSQLHYQEYSM